MLAHLALIGLVGLAAGAEELPWEEKADTKGVKVYTRSREGSSVKELKSVAVIDSPPKAVFKVLGDLERYKEIMPSTEESKVVAEEENGKVRHFYTVINPPMVSRRDYCIRIVDESDWKDGKGFLKTHWKPSEKAPPVKDGTVRVTTNEGSWLLEPVEDGKKTRATYYLFTDPGGSVPAWIANKANSSTIPDVFEALRKYSKEPKYQGDK
jgi:hypothetical protein